MLVTVRDANGNGIDPGDLQLGATAGALPEPPKPLALRAIRTDGMTDYLGVFHATPPASVQFKLTATRGGSRDAGDLIVVPLIAAGTSEVALVVVGPGRVAAHSRRAAAAALTSGSRWALATDGVTSVDSQLTVAP